MAEEVFNDIPEELHATILPREGFTESFEEDIVVEENRQILAESGVSVSKNQNSATGKSLSQLQSENGVNFGKILSFAGTCSINLVLPFVNGLMLGFGELVAHEISWNWNWFSKNNNGYRIFPESRKNVQEKDGGNNDKFL